MVELRAPKFKNAFQSTSKIHGAISRHLYHNINATIK